MGSLWRDRGNASQDLLERLLQIGIELRITSNLYPLKEAILASTSQDMGYIDSIMPKDSKSIKLIMKREYNNHTKAVGQIDQLP